MNDLLKKVKDSGMDAVATTDHGNMYGSFEFYNACRAQEINPIVGLEAYIAPGSRFDRTGASRQKEAAQLIKLQTWDDPIEREQAIREAPEAEWARVRMLSSIKRCEMPPPLWKH